MKKLFLIGAIVIAMLIVTGVQYKAQADGILCPADGCCGACYKNKNGQLRIVSGPDKCKASEGYINLCNPGSPGPGSGTNELACVTGALGQLAPSNGQILITSMKNIVVSDASEVFNAFYSSPIFVDDIKWGLFCNDPWVNTGCTGGSEKGVAYDLISLDNGCRSDDEEYNDLTIFTTCCKIKTVPATTYKTADYFPMGQGDTWTYNNNETHLISGTETVNGVDATKMILDAVNGDTYLLLDISSGALLLHKIVDLDDIAGCGWSQIVFTPAGIMTPAALSIGEKLTTSTTAYYSNCAGLVATQTITLEGTLEAVEDVTVPAGTFKNCLRYKILTLNIINDQGGTENSDQTWWIAKGVGIVKTIENGRTEELISATVGGVNYP